MNYGARGFFIKAGYVSNLRPAYFHDTLTDSDGIVHQPEVYPLATSLGERYGCTHVVDVGCGTAKKAAKLFPQFQLIGIDHGDNIEKCRQNYSFGSWIDHNLNKPGLLSIPVETLSKSIIICSDVIEHLLDPTHLLENLENWLDYAPLCLLSTPERDLVHGKNHWGPPTNLAHVREWNLAELQKLLSSKGFNVPFIGLTISNNFTNEKKTILAVIEGRRLRHTTDAAPSSFRVAAILTAYNEEDIIVPAVKQLLEKGIQVHIIDNWSSDSTYQLAQAFAALSQISLERYPYQGPSQYFHWKKLLTRVEEVALELDADWVVHHDVDEIRTSPWPGVSYRDGIYAADRAGFNCIDHTVITFHPIDNNFVSGSDFEEYFKYFDFGKKPGHFRQIKAWKNCRRANALADTGGHEPWSQERRIFPYKFLVKHYPIRSQQHGEQKIFHDRRPRWNSEERAAGWHIQYDDIQADHVFLRASSDLEFFDEKSFNEAYLTERLAGIGVLRDEDRSAREESRRNELYFRKDSSISAKQKPRQDVKKLNGADSGIMSEGQMVNAEVICVLGMHRSGTSLVSQVLNLLGYYLGPEEHLMARNEYNPKGYWEHQLLTDLNDEILERLGGSWHDPPNFPDAWENSPQLGDIRVRARALIREDFANADFWSWKDPRNCLLLPFWKRLMPPMKYLIILRNPVDVARSLQHRDGFSFEKGVDLWLSHVKSALQHSAGEYRSFVFYEDLLRQSDVELERLADFVGKPELSADKETLQSVRRVLHQELRHHQTDLLDAVDQPKLAFSAKALYLTLRLYVTMHRGGVSRDTELDAAIQPALDHFGEYSFSARRSMRTLLETQASLIAQVQFLEASLTKKEHQLAQVTAERERFAQEKAEMQLRVSQLTSQREQLVETHAQLQSIQDSLAWMLVVKFKNAREIVFPEGTRRRERYDSIKNVFKASLQGKQKSSPFNVKAYSALGDSRVAKSLLPFSCTNGSPLREIEASGLFDKEWYLAQNPDVRDADIEPLDHYVSHGAAEGRSPNPLFNTSIYVTAHNGRVHARDALLHFYRSGLIVAPGAYKTADVLIDVQRQYWANTETRCVRDKRSAGRRCAVYLQCGSGSVHNEWLTGDDRPWDLIVNHYDATYVGRIPCDIEFQQTGTVPGTKFTSFDSLLTTSANLVRQYDYLLLLDDDIIIEEVAITRLFDIVANNSLDLAQASLTSDSHCAHPVCKNRAVNGVRYVNTVEIMMPVLSRRLLEVGSHVFSQTVSGWGLDMVLGKLLNERLKGRAAVIESVTAKHTKPIDPERGAFYRMLHNAAIYPEIELTHLQKLYGTGRDIVEVMQPPA